MAEENIGANAPEVAEPVNPVEDPAAQVSNDDTAAKGEVASTNPKQSSADNAKFAAMRRQMEAASKRTAELEKELAGHKDLSRTIEDLYGYKGSPDQVRDMLIANDRGISVSQVAAERAEQAAKNKKLVENDPEYRRAIAENEHLQRVLIHDRMAKDLESLKAEYPEITADTIDELGDDFSNLIGLGWSAKEAYEAVQAKTKANQKKPPASTGSVKTSMPDKEFYSPEDVDRLTPADFAKDPNLLDKVKKSMAKW